MKEQLSLFCTDVIFKVGRLLWKLNALPKAGMSTVNLGLYTSHKHIQNKARNADARVAEPISGEPVQ